MSGALQGRRPTLLTPSTLCSAGGFDECPYLLPSDGEITPRPTKRLSLTRRPPQINDNGRNVICMALLKRFTTQRCGPLNGPDLWRTWWPGAPTPPRHLRTLPRLPHRQDRSNDPGNSSCSQGHHRSLEWFTHCTKSSHDGKTVPGIRAHSERGRIFNFPRALNCPTGHGSLMPTSLTMIA
jgi:hypothetical protein